jgi:signal transduction histidine kinase
VSDEALISNILHDLAGMMTSVQGLAQIVETQRDHPAIDELTSMLSTEADKAAEALRDLQLIRALAEGSPVEALGNVTISELFLAVREELSEDLRHGFTPPPPGLPDVFVDRSLVADLIARCYEAASETNPAEEHHVRATFVDGKVEILVDFGDSADLAAVLEGRDSGRKGMRAIAIAHRLLPRWGGEVEARVTDDEVRLAFKLPLGPAPR